MPARDKHLESLGRKVDATIYCETCKGNRDSSGRIARFPAFRQVCWWCYGMGHQGTNTCEGCNGTGWQVRAGGLEGGLAGLSRQAFFVWRNTIYGYWSLRGEVPMPSAPEILAEALKLVCEAAGLEVPDVA